MLIIIIKRDYTYPADTVWCKWISGAVFYEKEFLQGNYKKISASSSSYRYFSGVKKAKYYVRVRSYVKVGKKYYYGAWSKTRTINVKR